MERRSGGAGEKGGRGDGEKGKTPILDHTVLDHAREFHPAETHDGKALATILPDQAKQRELFQAIVRRRE